MKFDKRQMQAMLFILICMIAYTGWYTQNAEKQKVHTGIIRFHVLANSNSPADQQLKLKVRDGVLEAVNQELVRETMEKYDSLEDVNPGNQELPAVQPSEAGQSNVEGELAKETMAVVDSRNSAQVSLGVQESRTYLATHLDFIEEVAEQIIQENGYGYQVNAELGVRWIPEKTYGDMTFPAGNYEALNITIGSGEGNNWWCVLFPPLCLIDGSDDPDQLNAFETTSSAAVGMTEDLLKLRKSNKESVSTQAAIKLKFKTLELLEQKGE
ncbi:stage II sporulation protein R [Aminipila butyrica]|uniref:Stage II sporulation protein R n=1 Tax=Aminipila butyrica TaxID=433296 RepID=A0A858BSS3_9FIRM|nr:stage II sporulation protein R [Aminipila butyrica]QIB68128.1 stage II sporulation protein R [Aminipila butyrica]